MKRETALVKNTLILSISMFAPKLASMITLPIVTAYVAKADLGTFDLVGTISSLLLPLLTIQIQAAAFRFLIDVRDDENAINRIISTIVCFVLLVSIPSVCVAYVFMRKLDVGIRLLICLYFLLYICVSTFQQIARGLSKNFQYSFSAVIQTLTNLILIILLVMIFRLGLYGLLVSSAVSLGAALITLYFSIGVGTRIRIQEFSFSCLKELIGYSWPMVPNSLSLWAMSLSDRLVITSFLGVEANAIYSVANRIPLLFDSVQSTFIQAWQENASITSKDDDVDKYYAEMFDNVSRILSGLMCLLISVTPVIFQIFIRGEYEEAYYQIPILFMGMLFSCISAFMGGIYVAFKKTKSVGITTSIAAVINLLIDLATIQKIGIFAGSISTVISYFVLMLFRMINIQKFQKVRINKVVFIILIIVPSIMCVICFANNLYLNFVNFAIGMIFAFGMNRKIVSSIIKMIKKKLIVRGGN